MTERELRILMLEDVPTDARLIEDRLREDGLTFSARCVETREDFIRALKEFAPDVVLVDHHLPAFDGLSAIRIAREHRPDVPVVVVTGTLGDELAAQLMREGARDFILKDRMSRLATAVRRTVEEARAASKARALMRALQLSEIKYRRLFEAARDGVLILDAATGAIQDLNPFLVELLGYLEPEIVGKRLWEIGAFRDVASSRDAFDALKQKGYARYDNLPLQTKNGRLIDVEFVSNTYESGDREVIQFNIRDISERRAAQKAIDAQLDELRRFQKATVDRELRMKELKEENRRLREQFAAFRKEA